MDPGTLVGVILSFAAIFGSMVMEGGNPAGILLPPAMVLVFLGTFGTSLASTTMKDGIAALKSLPRAFTSPAIVQGEIVGQVVKLAEVARREGLLALEEAARDITDPFLKDGIELAVDGTDPEELAQILEGRIATKRAQDAAQAKFFNDAGGFAPTIGIIGTVLGLVHVLENLSSPDKLGHLIAGAFVATLWGVMTANALWLPIANKLKRVSALECGQMELVLEGILAVQSGSNPRVVQQRLRSMLPPAVLAEMDAASANPVEEKAA